MVKKQVFLVVIGIILFILRCISIIELWNEYPIQFYEGFFSEVEGKERIGILYISNLIGIILALTLITQLRIQLFNSIVIILYPLIAVICLNDVASIIMLQLPNGYISIDTLTLHIPTSIVGTYILFSLHFNIELINHIIGIIIITIWIVIVDFRLVILLLSFFCAWLIILTIFNIILIKYGILKK